MTAQLDTTYVLVCDLEDLAVGTPALADVDGIPTVSYTHLTLPTSDLV